VPTLNKADERLDCDVESFIYVLLWITRRYDRNDRGDKVLNHSVFSTWDQANSLHCAEAKRADLSGSTPVKSLHAPHNAVVLQLCLITRRRITAIEAKIQALQVQKFAASIAARTQPVSIFDDNEIAELDDVEKTSETDEEQAFAHNPEAEEGLYNSFLRVFALYTPPTYRDHIFGGNTPKMISQIWAEHEAKQKAKKE
jgi:hypothetical protein